MVFQNGDSYKVKWDNNSAYGQGKFQSSVGNFRLYLRLGVYTWKNGDRARFTIENGAMKFDRRVLFPEDDFRMEYRGEVKDDHIMHGQGSLVLEDGKTEYTGVWADGICEAYEIELRGIEFG